MSLRRFALAALASALVSGPVAAATQLLNVSYDPTRELYQAYNAAFIKHWKAQGGEDLTVQQSHGGSGKQARAVIDGLKADVVTLALAGDIDELHKLGKLLPADWQARLPDNSTPYTSTIVFLVRKGNPKGIKDWGDLTKEGVEVITPNPKTSGGARWNFLAAWAWAKKQYGSDEKAKDYVQALYKHVPVLDTGGRAATTTFMQNQIGDVLVTFENEAEMIAREFGRGGFEVVYPSVSAEAEPPVAVVDKVVEKKGSRAQAEAYLKYLWSDEGQTIAANNYLRPRNPEILAKFADRFPKVDFFSVEKTFGDWRSVQKTHFIDGGVFDQIYSPN